MKLIVKISQNMSRLRKSLFLILLCTVITLAVPVSEAISDVRVTFTFAAGGAVCGVYFFFYFVLGFSNSPQDITHPSALLDFSKEGLRVKVPALQLSEYGNVGYVQSVEIIKFRF